MMIFATFVLLALTVGLAMVLARATLNLIFVLLQITHPLLIRWHLVAFAAMLFWSWYLAPNLSAM
jgi:hypothetical protein